jgi:MYXO-CTERM domain-containing protein
MRSLGCSTLGALSILAMSAFTPAADATIIYFSDPSGLSAQADFQIINPTTLQISLRNTSTGAPGGFTNAASLLTGLSWDFGAAGNNASDVKITGGTIVMGATSQSLNFSSGAYGPGTNVGGEWGYGNSGSGASLPNMISGNNAGTTAFGGPNLDGPVSLNGPQAGLASAYLPVALGGMGAIQDEVVATLNLNGNLANLDFLAANGAKIEFGSDALFLNGNVPAPGAASLLVAGLALGRRRRRS